MSSGKFDVISNESVDDEQKVIADLTATYGLKRKLKNHRKVSETAMKNKALMALKAWVIF